MRSFIILLKQIGLQKIVAVLIAVVLISVAGTYLYNQTKTLPLDYQVKFDKAEYSKTIPEIERWLTKNPYDTNAKELLAALYIQKADAEPNQASQYLDKSLKVLNEIIKVDENRSESYRLIGVIYIYKADYANAEKNFRNSIKVSSGTNLDAKSGLGNVYAARGDLGAASSMYAEVLKKDPENEMANLGIARYFVIKKEKTLAVKHAEVVINTSKNYASLGEAYHIIGSVKKMGGYDLEALQNFSKSLEYRPGNVHTLVLYGEAQISEYIITNASNKAERIKSMTDTANKVIALKPDYIHGYTLLYKILLLENKYTEANNIGKKIVSLLPTDISLSKKEKDEYKEFYGGEIQSVTIKSSKTTVKPPAVEEGGILKVLPTTSPKR